MRSIKPGRGPSKMGVVGSVYAGVFGLFWIIMVILVGAPIFLVLFGIGFVIMAIIQGKYHYTNAYGKNRMSVYDITEENEEPEPLQGAETKMILDNNIKNSQEMKFCPYCSVGVNNDFLYCHKCGKKLEF